MSHSLCFVVGEGTTFFQCLNEELKARKTRELAVVWDLNTEEVSRLKESSESKDVPRFKQVVNRGCLWSSNTTRMFSNWSSTLGVEVFLE